MSLPTEAPCGHAIEDTQIAYTGAWNWYALQVNEDGSWSMSFTSTDDTECGPRLFCTDCGQFWKDISEFSSPDLAEEMVAGRIKA